MTESGTLILFSKYPAPGAVKTRLGKQIGMEPAARFARSFLLDLLHRFSDPLRWNHLKRLLCFDPALACSAFEALLKSENLGSSWALLAQSEGSLGQRLAAALEAVQERESGPFVFLGMDCPDLPGQALAEALTLGAMGQAVLRPARDGGYVLLALPDQTPATVFEGIRWSSGYTCKDQERSIREAGIEVVLQPPSNDVDLREDLETLRNGLKNSPELCPRTWECLEAYRLSSG